MILKRRILLFLLIYLFVTIYSCAGSKENYIKRYERFIGKVREKHENYNERDWKKADIQFKRFNDTLDKRFKNKLTIEEKNRTTDALNIYNTYRYGGMLSDNTDSNDINSKTEEQIKDRRIEELRRISENQEQISLQLEQLRIQILEGHQTQNTSQPITQQKRTEQESLIDKLQNDLLMEMLVSKRQGKRDISGKIKVIVFPTNYKRNIFRMDYNVLTPTIQDAITIINSQAKRYGQNISIDWEYRKDINNSFVSLNNYNEGLDQYIRLKNIFNNYDYLVLVYAIDMADRSYCVLRESSGRIETNAIIWFKDVNRHSDGVLAHEIFHAFGAEDLYYEQGVVPQEVELNFKTLLGNSIMITSQGSSNLDPINAWLMGWNKKPEPWYAWFINRRDNSVDIGLKTAKQ